VDHTIATRSRGQEAWGRALGRLALPLYGRFQRLERMLLAVYEDEPRYRQLLWDLRASDAYEAAYAEDEPLVSIPIPTYDNHRRLGDRAIPSILAQTYENFEVIVVGDDAPAETAEVVASFDDPRLRFHNLPYRGPYPADRTARWHVAGVPPWNTALRMARGRWIAPLNDDDAFTPDHLEVLLRAARERRHEVAYGRIAQRAPDGGTEVLEGRFPPEWSHFNWQAAVYHAGLRIWELELAHALWEMPADWAMCRRMLRAGVRFGLVDDVVVEWFPSEDWGRPGQLGAGGPAAAAPSGEGAGDLGRDGPHRGERPEVDGGAQDRSHQA
jgi:hypothetical protein